MHAPKRIGELLNVFYLLETPHNAVYGHALPTKLASPTGIHCSDSYILTKGILNYHDIMERLRVACDSENNVYKPATVLLEDQEHFRPLVAMQQTPRSDISHDRIGRPPKRIIDCVRFYDWHICSCILSRLELNTFQRALWVLLEAKQPIKITPELSVNPGEWVYPYGSTKPLHIIANMGRRRSSGSVLSSLLVASHKQDNQSDIYLATEEDPELTAMSPLLSSTEAWSSHSTTHPQHESQSASTAGALSNLGILCSYFIGSFLSQPLHRNKMFNAELGSIEPNSSTEEEKPQNTSNFNEKNNNISFYNHDHLHNNTYSFRELATLSNPFYQSSVPSSSEISKQLPADCNHLDSKVDKVETDEELIPEPSSRNICTLQTATADGIAILGEYLKNERLWKQQTAALLAKQATSSIEQRLKQRNRLKSAPKSEAILIQQFWSTVSKAISLKATDDICSDEIICLARDCDDNNTHNCDFTNHPSEILQRATTDNTMELSELVPLADPQSPVPPFEPMETVGPKNIDRESLYCNDENTAQKLDALQAPIPVPVPVKSNVQSMQTGYIDPTDVPYLCPLYQNMRHIFRLFSANIPVSLNLLQILFANFVLRFLTLSQLLEVSTSSCWYHTVTFSIRTGRITAATIHPQQGSRFLFKFGKASRKQSFLQLRSSYKYLPMDLSLLSVSYHVQRQQKTPQETFLACLEITRAAICRLLYLCPSTQHTPEIYSLTQLFMLADHISAHSLILETRFFTGHSLLLNNTNEFSTLTEVDSLAKYLADYLISKSLADFQSFNTNILLSEHYLGLGNSIYRYKSQGTKASPLTSSNIHSLYGNTLLRSAIPDGISTRRDEHFDNIEPEATMLYNQLLVIYKDILPLFYAKMDDSTGLPKKQNDVDAIVPYLYYQSNIRYLLPYQMRMLLSLSASYITGNRSFIIRAPRKVGALRFVIPTFMTRSAALYNLRCAYTGLYLDGKSTSNSGVSSQAASSAIKKDYDSASLDSILRREQVHLILCEESKVEGFVNMYLRLLFGARVYDTVSREMFGQDIDKLLLNFKERKSSREQTHVDDISSMTDHISGQSSTFYPSSVSPINFADILGQKMLLDDMESTLFISIFSCTPHRNSVPVAEITKSTAFGLLRPRSSNCDILKCIGSNDCNIASVTYPYLRHYNATHKHHRTKDASHLGMELLDTRPVDSECHVRCVSYVIGPETENQKAVSAPSRVRFNLFDQSYGSQQSSRQMDQPIAIKVLVVTYDALHYNYAYTNGQILSLIKEAKKLDTLIVHRIKDHAPHLPLHMYKTDFTISVESTYLLNRDDDLRQEEETRKKLLQLQSVHSTNLTDKISVKQLQTNDKNTIGSCAKYSSVPSHEKISQQSCAADQTILSDQNDPFPPETDQQSEQSYVPYDTASVHSSSLTRMADDAPAHLLFFDLVALNYEPSIPILTNIYDMKLLDKVLTDPTIALLFLSAFKTGSCAIYLQDIHGYGPQISHNYPNLQILPLTIPQRNSKYTQSAQKQGYLGFFPLHQSADNLFNLHSARVNTQNKHDPALLPISMVSCSSYSSSLKHSPSKFKNSGHVIPGDKIGLIDKLISFDGFINDLNIGYNALLSQHNVSTKRSDAKQRHNTNNTNNTNFWSDVGVYMSPMVLTTTMNVSSLDSVASILARSHSIAFGRGSEENWLREIESYIWDSGAYQSIQNSIYNTMMCYNTKFPSVHRTSPGSSLDMTIVSDIRRSFPEKYLSDMVSHLERLQRFWISTDGSLFLAPASPHSIQKSTIFNNIPPNQSEIQTISCNMSIPFAVYDKLFMNTQCFKDTSYSIEKNPGQTSLYFVSSSGDSWSSISRSVVYQTRSISLLAVIEFIDIFKRLLYRQTLHSKTSQHASNVIISNDLKSQSFSLKNNVRRPMLNVLSANIKDTFSRVRSASLSILFPESHSCYKSIRSTPQPSRYFHQSIMVGRVYHLPNLAIFTMLNAVRLSVMLPRCKKSCKVQLLNTQCKIDRNMSGDSCIRPLTTTTTTTTTLTRIKNKLSYAIELENKATYVFKIPFKTQIQPKYINMLHKRPLLQHLYQLDNQNSCNLHESFSNRIDFSLMCSKIEGSYSSLSKYIDSLLFFNKMLTITDNNVDSDSDSRIVLSFPFTYSFCSSVAMSFLGSIPCRYMFNIFGCLLPLKMAIYHADYGPMYSISREDKLAGGFLIASSVPDDLNLCSIKYCSIKDNATSKGKCPGTNILNGPISLLSTFLSEINLLEEGVSMEMLSSMLTVYGQLCSMAHPLSPIMYKILANSTYGIFESIINLVRLINQENYTLNIIYTETPIIVAVCFAIRRLFIEFNLYGKKYNPMTEIIKQSHGYGAHVSDDDHNTLCSTSLQRLNNVALISATLNVNRNASNINSSPPLSNDSHCGSNCFNIRYTDASNHSSNENQHQRETANESQSYEKEKRRGRAFISPLESSVAREPTGNKETTDKYTPSRVLYIATREPPRKQSVISKADELGRITVSVRSEISAVDAAERANEPSEDSNDLLEFCQNALPTSTSTCPTNLLYLKEQGVAGPPTDGMGNLSALIGSHTEGKVSKPYTLYHDNSDDNDHDIDDAFIKSSGFNFILILVNGQDTLHTLGAIMRFALGDCNTNIIIPKSNEILAYITSTTAAVTTVGRKSSSYIGLAELVAQSKRSYPDKPAWSPAESSEPILKNLAEGEGKCIVLQTLASFIIGAELFRDAQRIHLFAMPCVPNMLVLEAIHRANMAEKIVCWSNPPTHKFFNQLLADTTVDSDIIEKLKSTNTSFQDVIMSLPDELQYMILNQAANKPLQQVLVSILGLIKEFGYNVSQFSILDDEQAQFAMPKLDTSMEQESLSTESQIDAERAPDDLPNNIRHDTEITEYGSQAITEYMCKPEQPVHPFTLDCVHRNNRHTQILRRCVKHAIHEIFQNDLSVKSNLDDFDVRHGPNSINSSLVRQKEYHPTEKDNDQTSGTIVLQETLNVLSSLHSAYSQITLPLRSNMYQMDLSACPLVIVKALSQAVFLSNYSSVSHFDAFILSSRAGGLLELNGINGVGAPTSSKFRLKGLIADIVCNNPEHQAHGTSNNSSLLTMHNTPLTPAFSTADTTTISNYPSLIDLASIKPFNPIRLYYGINNSTAGFREPISENSVYRQEKAALHSTRTFMPKSTSTHVHESRINTIRERASTVYEARNVSIKQNDSINKIILTTIPPADKLKVCTMRAYKKANPLIALGRELKNAFYSLLEGDESSYISMDLPESQVTRISLSPITSALSFKRRMMPFCERQFLCDDLQPPDYTPFKHQLMSDKPTINLNQIIWSRQLVFNSISIYPSYETINKSLDLQCKMAKYSALLSGSSTNQPNQEHTATYQHMYKVTHAMTYSINDSFSYRLHIINQVCHYLIIRYNEVSKLLRAQPSPKAIADISIFMNITRENNVKILYQSFSDITSYLSLNLYDKKVILYLLKYRKAKHPEILEISLNQYIRDRYAPRIPSNLCNRSAALKHIISQAWSDTSSNQLVDCMKTALIARIDELTAKNRDTEEAERSLIHLILYNLNCNNILNWSFKGVFNNYTTVQHIEATTNLAISNFGYNSFKRQDIAPLPNEYYITITAARCTSFSSQIVQDLPSQQKSLLLRQDKTLGLCAAEEYSSDVYDPPGSYSQCWKPLW